MNSPQKPILDSRGNGDTADPLDRSLYAFFRAEMPRSFAPPALPAASRRRFGWGSVFRSRMTLAASVAVLLTGSWFLAGHFQGVDVPSTASPGGPVIGKRDKPGDLKPKPKNETKPLDPSPERR